MRIKAINIVIMIIILPVISATVFPAKYYYNYDKRAAYHFLGGMIYEFYLDPERAAASYERASELSSSEHIIFQRSLQLLQTERHDEGYNMLYELFRSGFNTGRYGLHIYMKLSEEKKDMRTAQILSEVASHLYEKGQTLTAARIFSQKLSDRMYYYTEGSQFTETIGHILSLEDINLTYRYYFESILMQFKSRYFGNRSEIAETVERLETEYGTLPYMFYRIAFEEYIHHEDYKAAKKMLDMMNSITYGDINYFADNAEFYSSANDPNRAVRYAMEGIREFPQSLLVLQLASVYLKAGMFEEAAIIYDSVLERYPENELFYSIIASEYHKTGSFEHAAEFYQNAVSVFPDSPQLLNNYAFLLAENSTDLEKALEMVNKALYYEPDAIPFIDTKAWIYYRMGETEIAESILETLFKSGDVFYHESAEELFAHYSEIKEALGRSEDLKYMSLNRTAKIVSEALNRSGRILQAEL